MATFVHVYTGPDGQSVVEEREFEMQSFVDTEGAHGLSTGMINTPGITFRVYEPGYFLDFHTAPRRQYSITSDRRDRGGHARRHHQALWAGHGAAGRGPDRHRPFHAGGGHRSALRHHHPPSLISRT